MSRDVVHDGGAVLLGDFVAGDSPNHAVDVADRPFDAHQFALGERWLRCRDQLVIEGVLEHAEVGVRRPQQHGHLVEGHAAPGLDGGAKANPKPSLANGELTPSGKLVRREIVSLVTRSLS